MSKIYKYIALFLFIIPILSFSQNVENIHFEQQGKNINIYYDLLGYQIYKVQAYCSTDNGKTWGEPLKYVNGDVGLGQIPGDNKTIIWDVLKERKNLSGNISFKVETSIQKYTGTIPSLPDDDMSLSIEFTLDMLFDKEYLDKDVHGSFQDNDIIYGIILEVTRSDNPEWGNLLK